MEKTFLKLEDGNWKLESCRVDTRRTNRVPQMDVMTLWEWILSRTRYYVYLTLDINIYIADMGTNHPATLGDGGR